MTLLKEIGAILGFVAFGGMAVLAFLTFQQARHVRRLREWAGRSPERAAAEANRAAGGAGGAAITQDRGFEEPEEDRGPGPMERLRGELAYRYEEADRRSPADLRILLGGLLAVIVGLAIVTSGFGLLGAGSDQPSAETAQTDTTKEKKPPKVEVAILNGTAPAGGEGVPGIADTASGFVKDSGFKVGSLDNAPAGIPDSIVMYADGDQADAEELAGALEGQLGMTETEPITPEIEALAGEASLVLIIGQSDQGIS